ncbi:MAG: arsenate reductase [Bacteroidota bacterium]
MYIVYGIPNCDTVKKAITWLNNHKIPYEFHDYKKQGITAAKLKNWSEQVGWDTVLNKKSTTWRSLTPAVQATITNEKAAIKLLVDNTSGIKRPFIEKGGKVVAVGFDEANYTKAFKK